MNLILRRVDGSLTLTETNTRAQSPLMTSKRPLL
jgi:hypothetical protein